MSANKKLGGGVLLELSHEIDYATWLLGIHFTLCSSRKLSNLDLDVEDYANLIFEYRDKMSQFIWIFFKETSNDF